MAATPGRTAKVSVARWDLKEPEAQNSGSMDRNRMQERTREVTPQWTRTPDDHPDTQAVDPVRIRGKSQASAAAIIGSATAAYALGDIVLFIVNDGDDTAVFVFTSAAADATVLVTELGAGPIVLMPDVDDFNATLDVILAAP